MGEAAACERRFVSAREASKYSGLSRQSLRRLALAGKLTEFRPRPGKVLFDIAELDAAIRASAGAPDARSKALRQRKERA